MLIGRDGTRLELPYELNLWQSVDDPSAPSAVAAPVDAADYQIDPLVLM